MREVMRNGQYQVLKSLISRRKLSNCQIQSRNDFSLSMAAKFVESESKRCSKRKRGFAHYQKKNSKAKIPKTGHGDIDLTDYYFENGLRKVYPYFFSFSTFVKGRWIGRTVADVFSQEFKGVTNLGVLRSCYNIGYGYFISEGCISMEEEIKNGMLTVNGKSVSMDFKLQNQQFVEHKMHRHENPVVATPLEIIADTADLLVLNKPSSIPVHPCGRYRFNSLTVLLEKEYGYRNLRTLYRLDRLTSGVLLLPKTTAKSVLMEKQLATKQLLKEYVCRVEGEFPEGTIECKERIGVISIAYAVSAVKPDGKECHTTFYRLSYNGRSSVVKCIPHTGRTHQIRVHLQFLGYPILNDPVYNSTAFGPEKAKGGVIDKSIPELEKILSKYHNTSEWILGENPEYKMAFCGGEDSGGPNTACDNSKSGTEQDNDKVGIGNDICDGDKTADETQGISTTKRTGETKCEDSDVVTDETISGDKSSANVDSEVSSNEKNQCLSEDKLEANEKSTGTEDSPLVNAADNKKQECNSEESLVQSLPDNSSDLQSVSISGRKFLNPPGGWEKLVASRQFDKGRYQLEKVCNICKNLYREPSSKELVLFLHAVRYKGPEWEYSTQLPDWAREDWAEEDQCMMDWQS